MRLPTAILLVQEIRRTLLLPLVLPLLLTSSTTRSFLSDESVGEDSVAVVKFSPESEEKKLNLGGAGASIGMRKGTLGEIRGERMILRA